MSDSHPFSPYAFSPSTFVDLIRWRAIHQADRKALTFLTGDDGAESSLTYGELDRQARAVAAWLQAGGLTGERALLLYAPGLEYIAAFFGCLYAGCVAVPAYPPRNNHHMSRLKAIVDDARAAVILTTSSLTVKLEKGLAFSTLRLLATDSVAEGLEDRWREPALSGSNLAFLQYTSGSTGTPKGVMVTHGNLIQNSAFMYDRWGHHDDSVGVSWLPIFHDMGLIAGVLQPLYGGFHGVLMSPMTFLQRPVQWLKAITRYKGTTSCAPNFAYDLCIHKVTAEERADLELSSWQAAVNAAEPIHAQTMERFAATFGACGFGMDSFVPGYGLAEGTLAVSTNRSGSMPSFLTVDRAELEQHRVVAVPPGASGCQTLVGCGPGAQDQQMIIVDPESFRCCPPDQVGEIWVSGPSIAQGYWGREEATTETFQAYLTDSGEGPFLRTGDLGFLKDGQLYVTGRLKDLIIIRGRNLYPQDLELTVQQSHPALRSLSGAAFAVAAENEERLVIVHELDRRQKELEPVFRAILQAVSEQHEAQVHAIVLIKQKSLPKTSSGKVQRRACRNEFLAGTLDAVGQYPSADLLESGEQASDTVSSGETTDSGQVRTTFEIAAWLVARLSEQLGVGAAHIDLDQPFTYYGLDSARAVSLVAELETWLQRSLPATLVWDYPSIRALARHLAGETESAGTVAVTEGHIANAVEPIAIIGMGCRFPGANNPEAFWRLLHEGGDAITEVPAGRWNVQAVYDPTPVTPGKMSTRWGGFLEGVDLFSPQFFGISPREAIRMDPQQRVLLEVAWEALESAGCAPDRLSGSQTGVFVGISSNDYAQLLFDDHTRIDAYTGTGMAHSIAANRLSYVLDLRGPSMAVDTACSSSLVAVHLACQSLRNGESRMAIAGGVNLILTPELTITFSQARMMASDGRCKAFDAAADGYVRGEGCGVVILKPLSQALADGDRVLAVIRGSAVNQDGRSNGLTAPNGQAQQAVLRQALANAEVKPAQLSYVEVHGTGTALGDPIEVQALASVIGEGRSMEQPCVIGSVKTNIGHLEAAAGIASLIKVVLSLNHQEIPATQHLTTINPRISLAETPLLIAAERVSWPAGQARRFAGVSSFGFGGTNAHVVLEEPPMTTTASNEPDRPVHVLALSAQSETALRALALRYVAELPEQLPLGDVCFTANTGRSRFGHRLTVTADTAPNLRSKLQAFLGGQASGVQQSRIQGKEQPKVAFLFTGQGAQYGGMGRLLYETQPTFRAALDRCAVLLQPQLEQPLLSVLFSEAPGALDQTRYTQPALFALEYALAELWASWGVRPDFVMGHSVGEYVAACVAGVFSLEDGLQLVVERSRLMQALPEAGRMAAVFASEAVVATAIAPYADQLSIAAVNGPGSVTIAGSDAALAEVLGSLERQGIDSRPLKVSHAFHSPLMEPMLGEFDRIASRIQYRAPKLPLISNLTGAALEPGYIPDAAYWRRHVREPVQFSRSMAALAEHGGELYVEIGPSPILIGMGKRCLPRGAGHWLASLRHGENDWTSLLGSLGALYVHGVNVDWDGFDRDYRRCRVSLPTYPFERERYWVETSNRSSDGTEDYHRGHELAMTQAEGTAPLSTSRYHQILDTVREIVGRLLQIDPTRLDTDARFLELGADSLILVEALKTIQDRFGVQLSIRQLFEELANLDALTAYIDRMLPRDAPSLLPRTAAPAPPQVHHVQSAAPASFPQLQLPAMPAAPATGTENPPGGTTLSRLMEQQLLVLSQVMSQQLQLLGGPQTAAAILPAETPPVQQPQPVSENKQQASAVFVPFQKLQPNPSGTLGPRQQAHLSALIGRLTRRTSESKRLTQDYRSVLADNRASAGFRLSTKEMLYPIIGTRSAGSKVWDVDGNEYIDITMGFGVNLFGHSPAFLITALEDQLKLGFQLGTQSDLAGKVAQLFSELTGMERVAFCNSGTEAVMTALRLARTATGRRKIALFTGSYHGHFDGVLARAQNASNELRTVPMAPGVSPALAEDVLVLPYDDSRALEMIRAHAHELAAVLVEPVQSRRPDLQPAAFLHGLRRLTSEIGAVLIFDEVITGFRIQPGGAQTWFGVRADLATYGKVVGGGMPIGIVAGNARFMNGIDGGMWDYGDTSYPQADTTFFAGTFCKHPLTMAACHTVLSELKRQGPALQEQLNMRTTAMVRTLNDYFEDQAVPIRMVHFGSLFRFAFSGNMDLLFFHLLEKGIYIWEGRNCFLSTAHTDEDIERFIAAVKASVAEMRAGGILPDPPSGPAGGKGERGGTHQESAPAEGANQGAQVLPLTERQRDLWVLAQMGDDASAAYNEYLVMRMEGPFLEQAMRTAIQRVVDRHAALRVRFDPEGKFQHVSPSLALDLPLVDLSLRGSAEQVKTWMKAESRKPFDLVRGPLVRAHVLKLGPDDHQLVLFAHHLIMDGWSLGLLLQEIGAIYSAESQGRTCDLPSPLPYGDYIAWDLAQERRPGLAESEATWLGQLAGPLPVLDLPADRLRPPVKTYSGAQLHLNLDAGLSGELKRLGSQHGCTLYMTLLAAFQLFLYRLSGQEDILVGTPMALRDLAGGDNLIGNCVNLLPMRAQLAPQQPFATFLATVRQSVLNAYNHREYPFATLVRKLNLPRDPSRSALISASFNLDRAVSMPKIGALKARLVSPESINARFDIGLNVTEVDGELLLDLSYNTDLFDDQTIALWLRGLEVLLRAVCADPNQALSSLPLLTEADRRHLLASWNGENPASDLRSFCRMLEGLPDAWEGQGVHLLFEEQARRTPDATALIFEDRSLSYAALNQSANQLAHSLRERGIVSDAPVGICLDRSVEMVIGALGVLKAGGTYVPMDPHETWTAGQTDYGHVALLLTRESRRHQLPPHTCTVISLDSDWAEIARNPEENPAEMPIGEHAIYALDEPVPGRLEGTYVSHRSLVNYFHALDRQVGCQQSDVLLAVASITSCPAFAQLIWALTRGAQVIVASDEQVAVCTTVH